MFVNSLTFLVIVSKSLKYTTSMYLNSWNKHQLLSGLTISIQICAKYGFVFNFIKGKKTFETLRDGFPRVYFNITVAYEHVPKAERQIGVVKESTWSVRHTLPFRKIPEKVIIMMLNFSVFCIKNFPFSYCVGSNLSLRTIITGRTIDFAAHCKQ